MKSALPYVALVGAVLILGIYTWQRLASDGATPVEQEGFTVMCAQPDCSHAFVIPRDQSRTHPRGPNGEGFQCAKCGKFSAQMAVRCSDCGRTYLREARRVQTASTGCPYCTKPAEPAAQ